MREVKYTVMRMVRLTPETDAQLVKLAKIMGLAPAVAIRTIIEATVKAEGKKES